MSCFLSATYSNLLKVSRVLIFLFDHVYRRTTTVNELKLRKQDKLTASPCTEDILPCESHSSIWTVLLMPYIKQPAWQSRGCSWNFIYYRNNFIFRKKIKNITLFEVELIATLHVNTGQILEKSWEGFLEAFLNPTLTFPLEKGCESWVGEGVGAVQSGRNWGI